MTLGGASDAGGSPAAEGSRTRPPPQEATARAYPCRITPQETKEMLGLDEDPAPVDMSKAAKHLRMSVINSTLNEAGL